MQIVNTEGMSLIGPGSEWFWTMLQFVIVAVSLGGLYRQLKLQSGANAFEHLDAFERELASERLIRLRLAILVALRDGAAPAELPPAAANSVCLFWEKIGALTRAGHIDPKLLRNGSGPACPTWWAIVGPWVNSHRDEDSDPTIFENFEWLARTMDRLDRAMGVPEIVNEEWLARTLDRRIDANLAQLREEQALRAVVQASPDQLGLEGLERRHVSSGSDAAEVVLAPEAAQAS